MGCPSQKHRDILQRFNVPDDDLHLDTLYFPTGGMGAGIFCIEGKGALSGISVRHKHSDIEDAHQVFDTIDIKDIQPTPRIREVGNNTTIDQW